MERSVTGGVLKKCSVGEMPPTGYERKGICASHGGDQGSHHVCVKNIRETSFCKASGQTDWCDSKQDWCVCEWAFDRAISKHGCDSYKIQCDATNEAVLRNYERNGNHEAAACVRGQCNV